MFTLRNKKNYLRFILKTMRPGHVVPFDQDLFYLNMVKSVIEITEFCEYLVLRQDFSLSKLPQTNVDPSSKMYLDSEL